MGIQFIKKASGEALAAPVTDDTPFPDSVPVSDKPAAKPEKPVKVKKLTKKAQAALDAAAKAAETKVADEVNAELATDAADLDAATSVSASAEGAALELAGEIEAAITKKGKSDTLEQAKDDEALDAVGVKVELVKPTATITKKHASGVEEVEQASVGLIVAKADPSANVGLAVAMTKNLGNYNSIKYSVSLFMPSATTEEALAKTFQFVEAWVDAKMEAIGAELSDGE